MAVLYTNNAATTLSVAISDADTTITVLDASEFPVISSPNYAYLTITDVTNIEIVKCTNITGNVLTVIRAQENTTAIAWDIGTDIDLRVTAQMLTDAFTENTAIRVYQEFIATSLQTTFTVAGGYNPNGIWVSRNGSTLVNSDFDASSGTDIVLTTGATLNDLIVVWGYKIAPGVTVYLNNVADDPTPELGGELNAGSHTIGFIAQTATGTGATTIDWKLGNKFNFTFGAFNETFTFTAPSNPCNILLKLTQDGVGGRTATWPATVDWPAGTAPTLSSGANAVDIVSFYYDGSRYYGEASLDFF